MSSKRKKAQSHDRKKNLPHLQKSLSDRQIHEKILLRQMPQRRKIRQRQSKGIWRTKEKRPGAHGRCFAQWCAKPIWRPKYGQTLCDACTPPKRSRSKRPPSLSAVAALARALNLTYGQYMARIQIGGGQ